VIRVLTTVHYNRLSDLFTTLTERSALSKVNYAVLLEKGCSVYRRPPQPVAREQHVARDKLLTETFSVRRYTFLPLSLKSRGSFESLRSVYLWRPTFTLQINFVKKCTKNSDTLT
jgi:hypothetical protein